MEGSLDLEKYGLEEWRFRLPQVVLKVYSLLSATNELVN